MKPRNFSVLITAASVLLLNSQAFADDGTWNTTLNNQSWSSAANWLDNIIADGAGFTADFSTLNITANTTINLDGGRTIGNLIFGDTVTSSAANWILATGTSGALTLAGADPTITVNPLGSGSNVTISALLAGNDGFTKDGGGILRLTNGSNTISGPVVVSEGILQVAAASLSNATSVALNGGTLVSATSAANAIGGTISFGGGTLQYNLDPATDYSAQFSTAANQQYRINAFTDRTVTFSSNLASEGGSLVKLGAGTLILDAANTFTGTTTVSAGTLQLNNALALQNSALNTTASVTGTAARGIALNSVTSPTFGGLIGDKDLASLFVTGHYDSVTNLTLNTGTGANHTYTGVIADGATGMTLTKSGPGRQVLDAANTYTGGTIMNAGTLNYSNAAALSTGPITFTGGSILQAGLATTLANNISVENNVIGTIGTAGFATTLSGAITGQGTLTKGGGNVLTLTGGLANTIEGGFRVASGRLDVLDGLSLTNTGSVTVLSGGTLNYSKNFANGNDLTNDLTLSGNGNGGFGALNLRGNATATGSITLAADATISHDFNTATITGAITGTDQNLTLSTLTDNQPGMTVSGQINLGAGGLTVSGAANSTDYSIQLTADNTYSGGTTVTSGTLHVNNTTGSGTGSGSVNVDGGATLGGTGIIAGSVMINSGGTLAPGASIESLETGSLTLNGGAIFAYELNSSVAASVAGDLLAINGDLTIDLTTAAILTLTDLGSDTWNVGDKLTLMSYSGTWNGGLFEHDSLTLANNDTFTFGGIDWLFRYDDNIAGSNFTDDLTGSSFVTMTAIPEPKTALLGAIGLLMMFGRRRGIHPAN